ncbi:hypothetical protein Vadar_006812 [Vaccinium darrowii]|uniref:Uncharacterized protein n=1 Tax=Vaccinium darrowii TaxID=229202 RepID=A0ACB7WYW0_9ERIC|nr:hypothetical protein Vadar_006812 [Vaccinium darrowii]
MRKLISQRKYWWKKPMDELGQNELEQLRDSMEELKKNTANQANKLFVEGNTNTSQFFLVDDGIGMVDAVETIPYQIDVSSANPHVHNFAYGLGFF